MMIRRGGAGRLRGAGGGGRRAPAHRSGKGGDFRYLPQQRRRQGGRRAPGRLLLC